MSLNSNERQELNEMARELSKALLGQTGSDVVNTDSLDEQGLSMLFTEIGQGSELAMPVLDAIQTLEGRGKAVLFLEDGYLNQRSIIVHPKPYSRQNVVRYSQT